MACLKKIRPKAPWTISNGRESNYFARSLKQETFGLTEFIKELNPSWAHISASYEKLFAISLYVRVALYILLYFQVQ